MNRRTRQWMILALFGGAFLLIAASPLAAAPPFQRINMNARGTIIDVIPVDTEGKGRFDLLVIHRLGVGPDTQRLVSWFPQGTPGQFSGRAGQTIDVPKGASFLDTGNVDGEPGDEVILWTTDGMFFYKRRDAMLEMVPEPLVDKNGVVVVGPQQDLPYLDFVRDWTGDGREDILLHDFQEVILYTRGAEGAFEEFTRANLPVLGSYRSGLGSSDMGHRYTFSASFVIAPLDTGDVDGDGSPELLLRRRERMLTYTIGPEGFISPDPRESRLEILPNNLPSAEQFRIRSTTSDLNGDGLADFFATSDRGTESPGEVEGELRVFYGRKDGVWPEKPDQVLSADNVYYSLTFTEDMEGDGKLELILPALQLDVSDFVRVLLTRRLTVKAHVFKIDGSGRYGTKPVGSIDLNFKVRLTGSRSVPLFDFEDFNKDNVPDVAFGTDAFELSIFEGRGGRGGKWMKEKAIAKVDVDTFGSHFVEDLDGNGYRDFVIFYKEPARKGANLVVLRNTGSW